ncbi:MAG: hypothetical protein ABI647_11910 [Gemmatimonadota bacterium]
MAPVSPYRSLPAERRVALITHVVSTDGTSREAQIQRIVARGGGFRLATLRKWTAAQLAREVVRYNMESAQDELMLLHTLYVVLEPALQIAFLDAAGVRHDGATIPEDLATPYAEATAVRSAAVALVKDHGDDARRYLRTIALYNTDAWPGLGDVIAELE